MKNLQFQKYGRLKVICSTKRRSKSGSIIWICRCDCGNLIEIRSDCLLKGNTKSCGCLQKERSKQTNIIHGESITGKISRLYRIWIAMKRRCLNPKDFAYKYYGKKGISVCNEWKNNYQAFKFWALAHGYADNLTIDRIDHYGNYESSNCQWLTRSENARKAAKDRKKRILNFGEHVSRGRP